MARTASSDGAEATLPPTMPKGRCPSYLVGQIADIDYVTDLATNALASLAKKKHSWEKAFDAFVPRVVQDGESGYSCWTDMEYLESVDALELRATFQSLFACVVALTRSWNRLYDADKLATLINCGIKFSAAIGKDKGYRWVLNSIEEEYGVVDHAASNVVYARSGDGKFVVVDRNDVAVVEPYQPLPEEASEEVAQRKNRRLERHRKADDALGLAARNRMLGMTPLAVKARQTAEDIAFSLRHAKKAIADLRDWNQACDSTVSPLTRCWSSELHHLKRGDQAPAEFQSLLRDFFPSIRELLWAWKPDCDAERLARLINIANLLSGKGFGDTGYHTVLEKFADQYDRGRHVTGEKIYAITENGHVVVDRHGRAEVDPLLCP